jgi:hypothetical protein
MPASPRSVAELWRAIQGYRENPPLGSPPLDGELDGVEKELHSAKLDKPESSPLPATQVESRFREAAERLKEDGSVLDELAGIFKRLDAVLAKLDTPGRAQARRARDDGTITAQPSHSGQIPEEA